MSSLSRRSFLTAVATGSGLLLARPFGVLADALPGGASRFSPLRAYRGLRVVSADLHNHTFLSDGDGDPAAAYSSMRRAGVEVAALTDHATLAQGVPSCGDCHRIEEPLSGDGNTPNHLIGINEESWTRLRALADGAHDEGRFVALRGFEWSSPTLGHMNVWFSDQFTDPAHTLAIAGDAGMRLFYDWLDRDPRTPVLEGGADGLAGFNHPGREAGRFGQFTFDPDAARRVVSIEVFNRGEDYLFEGVADGATSPIAQALNAGWSVGLIGVSDHHGSGWGTEPHKGRAGLWVTGFTRAAVREAMEARRFYASIRPQLRLSATAEGVAMGGRTQERPGKRVRVVVDLDGAARVGETLRLQVMGAGEPLPVVLHEQTIIDGVTELTFDRLGSAWAFLRIAGEGDDPRDTTGLGRAVAYSSPWFFTDMTPQIA